MSSGDQKTDLQFVLLQELDQDVRDFIHEQIKAFNDEVSEYHRDYRDIGKQPLDILVQDDSGVIVGGLTGSTYWGWLDVHDLWLQADMRRQGYGRRLLLMAEEAARRRGCQHSLLSTFSFQARGFYQKIGYRVVGELEDYPPGSSYYLMRKDL